jgi:hypothetical protein
MSDAASSIVSASERRPVPGRPFEKGVSGNPLGRPKAVLSVQELARAHTEDAIRALVAALQNPRERVQAAQVLLDRAWGKPVQPVEAEGAQSISVLHLVAAKEVSEQIQRALSENGGTAPPVIDSEPAPQAPPQQQQHRPDEEALNLCEPAVE